MTTKNDLTTVAGVLAWTANAAHKAGNSELLEDYTFVDLETAAYLARAVRVLQMWETREELLNRCFQPKKLECGHDSPIRARQHELSLLRAAADNEPTGSSEGV